MADVPAKEPARKFDGLTGSIGLVTGASQGCIERCGRQHATTCIDQLATCVQSRASMEDYEILAAQCIDAADGSTLLILAG